MKNYPRVIPIAITLLINLVLTLVSIYINKAYGALLFLIVPFLLGLLPTIILSRSKYVTWSESIKLGSRALALGVLGLLVFALEGFICLVMAYPILWLITLLGSYIAFDAQKKPISEPRNLTVILVFIVLGAMGFDMVHKSDKEIQASTSVLIQADIEKVWHNIIAFDTIDAPNEWIFKTGIAYPLHANIEGGGVGAIRYCNFTTGSFVEPITTWNEPTLLQFDVLQQPVPLHEVNPFWDVHPPHLDGYFQSQRGQFKLSETKEGLVLLEGTTYYTVDMFPEFYWRWWSSFIIHKIHYRVLNHIKTASES